MITENDGDLSFLEFHTMSETDNIGCQTGSAGAHRPARSTGISCSMLCGGTLCKIGGRVIVRLHVNKDCQMVNMSGCEGAGLWLEEDCGYAMVRLHGFLRTGSSKIAEVC
jgi:hypothetical protein